VNSAAATRSRAILVLALVVFIGFNVFIRKRIASMSAMRRIGKVTRLLPSPRGASSEVTR
jgi:hypothetical protein